MEGGEEEPLQDDSEVEVDPVEDCKDFQQFAKGSTRLPSGFAFWQDPGFEKATSSPSPGPLRGKVSAAARVLQSLLLHPFWMMKQIPAPWLRHSEAYPVYLSNHG